MAFGLGEFLGVVGVAGVPAALALTMPATTKGEFRFLKGCLLVSGALIVISLLIIQWTEDWGPTHMKVLINAAIAAVVVGGISYGLEWIRKKEAALSSETPTAQPSSRGPTLEATNNSTIDATGATIPGDLPFQFGRADKDSLIAMPGIQVTKTENGWEIRPPENINVQFPPPPANYASIPTPQLRRELQSTANELRVFQTQYTADFRQAVSDTAKLDVVMGTYRADYEKKFSELSLSLASAALSRIGTLKLPKSANSGGRLCITRNLLGQLQPEMLPLS
jgi:hypothetical protein